MEIERKFLIKELPKELSTFKHSNITQYYLSIDPEIRIRSMDDLKFFLTSKSNGDMIRYEAEINISKDAFRELSKGCDNVIKKTRYFIGNFELDIIILPIQLKLVEVEFNSEEEANKFIIPDWFGEEITKDKRYKNKNIAMYQ